jgi:hypothetical protein
LIERAKNGLDLDNIALKHQRTQWAVKARIMGHAINMMDDKDLSIEEVANMVHISVEDIETFKQCQEKKADKPKNAVKKLAQSVTQNNIGVSSEEIMTILTEIRDYLKIIAEK